MKLQPGDEFAVCSPTALGCLIRMAEKVKAGDNESKYNHTGIILDGEGTTLESKWTVRSGNLWKDYVGCPVLVVRNIYMTPWVFQLGYEKIKRHIGQWYPVHRLALHLLGLAKWVHWDDVVCSELTAKFEVGCAEYFGEDEGAGFMRNHYGVNPDHLTDRWEISRYYHTIFEGVIPSTG